MTLRRTPFAMAALAGILALSLAACESGGSGTSSAGVGTVGGAAIGAGAGRLLFGNSTTGMLIGAGVGGLAGNMTVDRQAEQNAAAQRQAEQDAAMQRQLDFERQQALQAEETRRQIEEQRLFEEWRRQQGSSTPAS